MNLPANFKTVMKLIRDEGANYAFKYVKRRIVAKANDFPNILTIEASSACNIKCEFCWIRSLDKTTKRGNMDLDRFKRIIDDTKDFCTGVQLQWRGEPMVNRDLYKMVEYATKNHIFSSISTNATLLDPEAADNFLKAGLGEVALALDGATKETYEIIRKGANYEVVLENIKHLVKRKKELRLKKPHIKIQFIVTKKNFGEIERFKKLAKEINADEAYLKSLYMDRTGGNPSYVKKMEEEYFVELDGIPSRYTKKEGDGIGLKSAGECKNIRCPQYSKYPVISFSGDVFCCCFDICEKYNFGNVAKRPFKDIWKDKRYADFRKNVMSKRRLPMCKGCLPLDKNINLKYI